MSDRQVEHPAEVVLPGTVGPPGDRSDPFYADDVPFWKPDWHDVMRHLGWRWLYLLPIAILVALVFGLALIHPALVGLLLLGGWKVVVLSVGLSMGATAGAVRSVMHHRMEPFCIHCGYDLTGLVDGGRCPECGRAFSLERIDEYRRDPDWFIQRHRKARVLPVADEPFDAGSWGKSEIRKKESEGNPNDQIPAAGP